MKFIILLLSIITIIEAAPPPAPQYEGQSVGAMPCYLGCCKLIHILFLIYFFISIYTPIYMNINFDFIMCIRVFTLGTPCERINCINGGYCIQPATPTSLAYCHCPPQYTGYRCEQAGKINVCSYAICHYVRTNVKRPWEINISFCIENCVFHLSFVMNQNEKKLIFFLLLLFSFIGSLFKFSMQSWNLSERS